MSECTHQKLVLLAPQGKKVRCRYCHLTIDEADLVDGFCPECYEVHGVRRSDFEPIEAKSDNDTQYSCETCGAIISG